MKIATVDEMREMDRRAVEEIGIPDRLLMENAGQAAYSVIVDRLGVVGKSFAALCGPGNNGGDALVVARKIHSAGGDVTAVVLGEPDSYPPSAAANLELARTCGVPLEVKPSLERLSTLVVESDAVVDGLLGTGLTRDVGGALAEVIGVVNRSGRPVLSIDIPSGVDGDTGHIRGIAVRADWTVTFGLPKLGNLLYPGYEHGGALFVSHISFPPELQQWERIRVELNLPPALPERAAAGHKGSFGDALFVAGASNYLGAPSLAALSMLKAGGGYSRLAAPRSITPFLATLAPEVVLVPQDETGSGSLASTAEAGLLQMAELVDMAVVGPGLSLGEETRDLVRGWTAGLDKPLLLDGDALTAVAAEPDVVRGRALPTVLTPHAGEMARLLGRDVAGVAADPVGATRQAASELEAIVVLKGAHSLVGLPDGRVWLNPSGGSGMATAGSGDVLTGTVAAMFGLGLGIEEAVRSGVFVHGLAGDLAAERVGEDGMTARDILDSLPEAVRLYREDYDELMSGFYGVLEVI